MEFENATFTYFSFINLKHCCNSTTLSFKTVSYYTILKTPATECQFRLIPVLCVLTGAAQYVLWMRSRNENPGMTQTSNPGSENIYCSASVFLSEKWAF